MADKLKFPIGFDLKAGVKQVKEDWENTYHKKVQDAIDKKPLKLKLTFDLKGVNLSAMKEYLKLSKDVERIKREALKTEIESEKLATQAAKTAKEKANATAATLRAETAELRLADAKKRSAQAAERQNSAYKSQDSLLGRIWKKMVAYYSIRQVLEFGKNIMFVTMELEKQRRSLGALIGDMNEANKMFSQIKEAAIKSPFKIKELTNYTKQLAAYKIGINELFDTTMRLADISAGLGVSMDRIILAYGQIRATGYLRATEVRQLTEAGIPIVEELAKKMSALRQETISAADVMSMISDRAISFSMVKDVFDDMTKAGGMFYKMQEIQAETLLGQWNNLKDSLVIMYDEIGNTKVVNSAIKESIVLVKSLIDNWRTIGNTIKYTTIAFGALWAATKFLPTLVQSTRHLSAAELAHALAKKVSNDAMVRGSRVMGYMAHQLRIYSFWMKQAANAQTGFGRGVKTLMANFLGGGWIGIVVSVLTVAVSMFISARKEAKRLNEELDKIGAEGSLQADQSARNFERLARVIRDSANGSAQQTTALAEMKRAYGEFLPSQDEHIIKLAREKQSYEAVTQAIREKVAMQVQEQKISTVTSDYGGKLASVKSDIRDSLQKAGFRRDKVSNIFSEIEQGVKDGTIKISTVANELPKIIKRVTGLSMDYISILSKSGSNLVGSPYILKYIGYLTEYESKLQDIFSEYDASAGLLNQYYKDYKALQTQLGDISGEGTQYSFQWNESKTQKTITAYHDFVKKEIDKANESLKDENKIKFSFEDSIDFDALYKAIGDKVPQLRNVLSKVQKEYDKIVPKGLEKKIREEWQDVAKTTGASMDRLQHYFKDNETKTQDWVKSLKDAKTRVSEAIFDAKKLGKDTTGLDAEEKALDIMIKRWEYSKKTRLTEAERLKNELSAVEKIYKRYTELRKVKSEIETMATLEKEFEGVDLKKLSKAYNADQMLKVYKEALSIAERLGKQDLVLEIQTKIGDLQTLILQKKLDKELKGLSEQLSRTKAAKEFFDKMLGLTGDKQLSATLTMSVYGTTGEDLKDKLIAQVQKAFEGTDVGKAINHDLKTIDLSVLRKIYEQLPEDIAEKQGPLMKQTIDMLEKQQSDISSRYAKLLLEYDDMQRKRVTITAKATRDIKLLEDGLQAEIEAINKDSKITDKESAIKEAEARAASVRQAIEARLKLDLDKLTPEYIRFFSSINAMSIETANTTRTKLRRALFEAFEKGAISAEQLRKELKAIDTQFRKLNENATLFSSYMTGGIDGLMNKLRESADELDAVAARMKKLKSVDEMDEGDKAFVNRLLNVFGDKGKKNLSDLAASFKGDMSKMGDAVQEVGGKMQGMFSNASGAIAIVDMIIKAVHQSVEAIQQVIDQINSMRNEENQIGGWFKYISDFDKYAMSGWENLKSGNIAGALADTISSIISIFQNIQADKIKALNEEIEAQQEVLDNLAYAYSRLEKAQEKAFGTEYISNYRQQLANLQAQLDAYQKQLEAEEAKGKKSDSEKIKDYNDAIRDVRDAMSDMQAELSEHFLGTDLSSAARDFAQSWIDAYKEFGSTTDAMKEKFSDMIESMIIESFAAEIMKTALKDVFAEMDKMMKDGTLDVAEAAQLADMTKVVIGNMDVGLNNLMDSLSQAGLSIRGMGSGLTGISRDIATASEESILGLAAGINTQNHYISQVPTKMDIIIGLLQGGSLAQGSSITLQDLVTLQNQHLSYLPTIAQHTADTVAQCQRAADACETMVRQLGSVIKPQGAEASYRVATILSNK